MRAVLVLAAVELRRFLADRSNIFFVFVFPLLLVLLIGSQFGEGASAGRVALAAPDDDARATMVAALEEEGLAVTVADDDAARELVARGRADVGLFVPDSLTDPDGTTTVEMISSAQARAQITGQRVRTAVDAVGLRSLQVSALASAGADEAAAREAVAAAAVGPRLDVTNVSEIAQEMSGLGQFDYGAAAQLLLFVFLISLTGSATLIQARRDGVISRTLAAPVSTAQVITGQGLGRLAIAAFQGGYIMAASSLLFGVDWGNLALAVLVVLVFGAVAAGAALVLGSALDNENAAVGAGVGLGLVLGALGGGMFPLELFGDTLRTVAHVTPHTWAYEALAEVQRHGGTLADILPELGVLAGYAAALVIIGTWTLRRSLARGM